MVERCFFKTVDYNITPVGLRGAAHTGGATILETLNLNDFIGFIDSPERI